MRHTTATALIILSTALASCASPIGSALPSASPAKVNVVPSSPSEIAGTWDSQVLAERGYHRFSEDGTLVIAYVYEQLDTNPVFSIPSRYWFDGEVFHIEDECGHGTYRLTLTRENGRNQTLTFELIDDECDQRASDWKRPMRWIEP